VRETQVIPAIDLRRGHCVRLRQGDYDAETVFNADPVATARKWEAEGASLIHVVDLDGARLGRQTQLEVIRRICDAVEVPVELGGGLRTAETVEAVLAEGVTRAVLGSAALEDESLVKALAERFPGRIVVSIDARDGKVQGGGWLEDSAVDAYDFAARLDPYPLAGFVFTDIKCDGMLTGPNTEAVGRMAALVSTPVIASGGVGTLEHVSALAALGVAGIIIGRALYDQRFSLSEAIRVARASGEDGGS